jgi:hypothetical protein
MKQITCSCIVMGHLRYGHYTLNLTEEEYKEFESMSDDEKKDWIKDGDFTLDSFSVDDRELDDDYRVTDMGEEISL